MIAMMTSGGKESHLAYELVKDIYPADYFVTVIEDGKVASHGTKPNPNNYLIDVTGKVNAATQWLEMFNEIAGELQKMGVTRMIVGTIDPIPEFFRQRCDEIGLEIIAPLAGWGKMEVLKEVVKRGIKAKIISTVNWKRADMIGRMIDEDFINSTPDIDVCGENGEYHTEVI